MAKMELYLEWHKVTWPLQGGVPYDVLGGDCI